METQVARDLDSTTTQTQIPRTSAAWQTADNTACIHGRCGHDCRTSRRRQRTAFGLLALWMVAVANGCSSHKQGDRTNALQCPAAEADEGKDLLVVYDVDGSWGYIGELYAIGVMTYASRFSGSVGRAVSDYTCGEASGYDAVAYVGSSYDAPLPSCLLDDIASLTQPVIWLSYNIWQLEEYLGRNAFAERYGFVVKSIDDSLVERVRYKGRELPRHGANDGGLVETDIVEERKAAVIAEALRDDGSVFPWAVGAGNLTYVSEIPFSYMSSEDRVLVFADILFDVFAPDTVERHRALLRIEDVAAHRDPARLAKLAEYLKEAGIPFGVAVVPEFRDPHGVVKGDGVPGSVNITDDREIVEALRKLVEADGTIVMHGVTHQRGTTANPYNAASCVDTEFYEVVVDDAQATRYVGPLPEESPAWLDERLRRGLDVLAAGEFASPQIFETPHYTGSATTYRGVAKHFEARWERTQYFSGLLRNDGLDYDKRFSLFYPYVVRDVYGSPVLPENLGCVSTEAFYEFPTRMPEDIIRTAEKNLVVRDGFASFYFHPFLDIELLKETVEGIERLGYTFVSPVSLLQPEGEGVTCGSRLTE